MAKPPADVDPEKFILGRGSYHNLSIAISDFENGVFRITSRPMPVLGIALTNLVFVSFFFGLFCLLKFFPRQENGPWTIYGIPIGMTIFTCGGFTAIAHHTYAKAKAMGPWLIFDIKARRMELPREGEVFEREEIVHLQYITTKRLDEGGVANNERLTELNLLTCRGGVRQRWPLLRSICGNAFDALLEPLIEHTDLPVVRVEDEWLGWKVNERPYGR